MKILILAPIPPPFTGNSLPVQSLYNHLSKNHIVDVINLNKKDHKAGVSSLSRIFRILSILWKFFRVHKNYDLIYLTVAESFAGNMRDCVIYFIARKHLSNLFIHMLGGAAMANILNPENNGFQFRMNKKYVSQLGAVVVEGQKQKESFMNVIEASKIHINSNYAEEFLFVDKDQIRQNFANTVPLNILFLSNLLPGKGHMELIEAYHRLDTHEKEQIHLELAGKIVDPQNEERFYSLLKDETNVVYHGSVAGEVKKDIYSNAHVFCLPTYYPYEGQPFCIVEAYASGCFVVTSNHSGIPHIYKDQVNGYAVENKSIPALVKMLRKLLNDKHLLMSVALSNLETAHSHYTEKIFLNRMDEVIESIKKEN